MRASLTLLRLSWGAAHGETRRRLAQDHAALWRKLRELDPTILTEPAQTAA